MWSLLDHYRYMAAKEVRLPALNGPSPPALRSELDWKQSVEEYFSHQTNGYCSLIKEMVRQLRPMKPECRISVLVPARNEALNLPRLLDLLYDQRDTAGRPLARCAFEVVILLNRTAYEPDDGSYGVICSWMDAKPRDWELLVVEYIHPADERAPLTKARKLLADLAVYRSAQRLPSRSIYLASEDADILWMDPCQLAVMIRALDESPEFDAVRGQQDRCPWLLCRWPLLFLMRRSWNFSESHAARRSLWPRANVAYNFNWNRIVTSGWNTVIRSEAYVAVGGYTEERQFEEDMDIGEKISVWRGSFEDGRFVPCVEAIGRIPTRSEGSPRRWLYHLSTNLHPYAPDNGYENFFSSVHERMVKRKSLGELAEAARAEQLDIHRVGMLLSADYRFLLECTPARSIAQRAYSSVLASLGFPPSAYKLTQDWVEIKSVSNPAARIRAYAKVWGDAEVKGGYPEVLPRGRRRTWRISAGLHPPAVGSL